MTDAQRQAEMGALKVLSLALFIAAEHHRLVGWTQVKPYHIPEFLFKVWIIGQFEGMCQMGLQVIGSPELMYADG